MSAATARRYSYVSFVTDVPGAQYLLDLPWYEKLLELGRQVVNTVRDVQVSNYQAVPLFEMS